MPDRGVGVKATFSVRGQEVHQFSSSEAADSPPATAEGVGEQGAVEGTGKYDYRYTGRHDHGTLPALRTGGPHGELAKALLAAKEDSDAFLTGLINQELTREPDGRGVQQKEGAAATTGEDSGGGDGGGQEDAVGEPESMELEPSGATGGLADESPGQGGGNLPPSSTQPAKRPRP